eukprot:SAG11_NODE_16564_length_544_cov_0.586517_2_plen_83_part_01
MCDGDTTALVSVLGRSSAELSLAAGWLVRSALGRRLVSASMASQVKLQLEPGTLVQLLIFYSPLGTSPSIFIPSVVPRYHMQL